MARTLLPTLLLSTCLGLATGRIVATAQDDARVAIVPGSGRPSEAAAAELRRYLMQLYPGARFDRGERSDATHAIYVGTAASLGSRVDDEIRQGLDAPGAYLVTARRIDGRPTGWIVGADPQGLWSGVYGLLQRLGCGFYLSFETLPPTDPGEFSFDRWHAADRPLVPVRLVFNWHNFLSGCSTWQREHWNGWIDQAQKMGYNAVMVHAYGNNPMAGFSFRGVDKPVGYLSSTRVGRDWSTNHVNDVRRLFGGQVFDGPVFGCAAAIEGTDRQRTQAARGLMSTVFEHAQRRSVDVYFAVDVDTPSANPQELILQLPESGRFDIGGFWLPRPDMDAGYGFYRAQVKALLDAYPQIDCLVVWHRKGGTPWMAFPQEKMPAPWRREFNEACRRDPAVATLWHAHHLMAIAKIVRAFQRAVVELDRPDVRIAFGSWDFNFLPAADRFLPNDVALIPLDWMVLRDQSVFTDATRRAAVARVATGRPVIPIAWAHHDDGNYVGRPYTPYENFFDLLSDMRCDRSGYGIIHWTTKPLDLYFKSLVNQCWAASRNQPLDDACRQMAVACAGPAQAEPLARYLYDWVTTMPKIGRETSDFFIDHPLTDRAAIEAGCQRRLRRLDAIDDAQLTVEGRGWVAYFKGLEQFIQDVYRTEESFNQSKRLLDAGDLRAARQAMAACKPEAVIERFATFSQHGGMTRGERGLVVSMNTRWLPHYVRFRQQLGIEPIRYNFSRTSHDPLAQSRGIFTFHFDPQRRVWQTWGTEETGHPVFALPQDAALRVDSGLDAAMAEICRTGIESADPIRLSIAPIMRHDSRRKRYRQAATIPAGRYRLVLLLLSRGPKAADADAVQVRLATTGAVFSDRIEWATAADSGVRAVKWSHRIELDTPGAVRIELVPSHGKARLCGLVLEPVGP